MRQNPLKSIKNALNRLGPGSDPDIDDHSAALYECPGCERVYISEEMGGCPECEIDVEEVPSTEPASDD